MSTPDVGNLDARATERVALETFAAWGEGEIDAASAIGRLAADLAAVDAALEPLEYLRSTLRQLCEQVVMDAGEKFTVAGYGEFAFAPASVAQTYDRKRLDALLHDLIASGEGDWAQRLETCRKETTRAGSLRITKSKERTEA